MKITREQPGDFIHFYFTMDCMIPKAAYRKIMIKMAEWNNYTSNEYVHNDLVNLLKELNGQYKFNLTIEQLTNMRMHILDHFSHNRTQIINQQIKNIVNDFNRDITIDQLSKLYNYPPLSLMRRILIFMGVDSKTIEAAINETASLPDVTANKQLQYAKLIDYRRPMSLNAIIIDANLAEIKLANILRSHGIRFKTEDDLVAEQVSIYGRAVLTPDILLEDAVYVGSRRIYWIDIKNYVGTTIMPYYGSNRKQFDKYYDKWGLGLVIYTLGAIEGLKFKSALVACL